MLLNLLGLAPEPLPVLRVEEIAIVKELEPRELSVEEKIEQNYYKCDERLYYIRADNAKCLKKPVEPVREPVNSGAVNTQVKVQTRPVGAGDGSNTYVPGNCTWYVKNQLNWVPNNLGNANMWAANASAQGFTVSNTPIVVAVVQTTAGALGHVVVVVGVGNGTVTVSEMNYNGLYQISSRTEPVGSFVYIY
jgi:surface antigen